MDLLPQRFFFFLEELEDELELERDDELDLLDEGESDVLRLFVYLTLPLEFDGGAP
jgi:hypothetical protein